MASRVCRRLMNSNIKINFLSVVFKRNHSQSNVNTKIENGENMRRNKLSTLYVPGRYGAEMYQIVKPVIDVQFIIDNSEKIKHSCHLRNIGFNIEYAIALAKEWENHRKKHLELIEKDREYFNELTRLQSEGLTAESEAVKTDKEKNFNEFIASREKLHDIEEIVMPIFKTIPNFVDISTPVVDQVQICREPQSLTSPIFSHTEIGQHTKLLRFSDVSPTAYYLAGTLAELDLAIQFYFCDTLESKNYAQMSCIDFCKSFIIEAIGCDPYSSDDCIEIQSKTKTGQKLNLVGGASLESFCAYLCNTNTNKSTLPMKYFSLGRRYCAGNRNSKNLNLFNVVQSTNVHCLILSDQLSEKREFDTLFQELVSCYSGIEIPFRTVDISAKNLSPTESKRRQLELWSPSYGKYIPVAHVSLHNDFISKRLNITFGVEHHAEGYCSIIEGVAVNTSKLVGCMVENFQSSNYKFDIPSILTSYICL